MEFDFHTINVNLKVMSKLGDDDRILVGPHNEFSIGNRESNFLWFYRWFTGQSRHSNFEAIDKCLKEALRMCGRSLPGYASDYLAPAERTSLPAGFEDFIRGACQGLRRIAVTTYRDDPNMTAKLEVLCDHVEEALAPARP
jgi:hypothetical protein